MLSNVCVLPVLLELRHHFVYFSVCPITPTHFKRGVSINRSINQAINQFNVCLKCYPHSEFRRIINYRSRYKSISRKTEGHNELHNAGQRWKWVSGSMGHCQWPIDPWWWNNCAVACNFLFLVDINKLLTHSISPLIIAGDLILTYDFFALKTERVVQYHHATRPPCLMRIG